MKVRIKTWNEMVQEFGVDNAGDIKCRETFNTYMEDSLPKDRIIEIEKDENNTLKIFNNVHDWYVDDFEWNISDDMIEEIIEE